MELCLARTLRLVQAAFTLVQLGVCLLGVAVSSYVLAWFTYGAWYWGEERHSLAGSAVFILLIPVIPVVAAVSWRRRQSQPTVEKIVGATLVSLQVALLLGLAVALWSLATATYI